MDRQGYWDLFCKTGNPIWYVMYSRCADEGFEDQSNSREDD